MDMTDKEKIRAEVERLLNKEWKWHSSTEAKFRCEAYKELLEFINSLDEEQVSDDLEEEIERFGDYANLIAPTREVEHIAHYFANWQKRQMMKEAIEVYVCTNFDKTRKIPCSTEWGGRIPWSSIFENCNVGDKVKLIVVMED